jgi:hypothetical protein
MVSMWTISTILHHSQGILKYKFLDLESLVHTWSTTGSNEFTDIGCLGRQLPAVSIFNVQIGMRVWKSYKIRKDEYYYESSIRQEQQFAHTHTPSGESKIYHITVSFASQTKIIRFFIVYVINAKRSIHNLLTQW